MLLLASLRGSGAASRSSGLLGLMRPRLALPARRPQRWRGMSTAPAYTLTPDDLASFHRDVRPLSMGRQEGVRGARALRG